MQRILIIESSATLLRVLSRKLAGHYQIETERDHQAGLERLSASGESFAAVVIGWPELADPAFELCLTGLSAQPDSPSWPLLVLSHGIDTPKLDWVAARPQTALLPWDDFREATAVLQRLLAAPCEEATSAGAGADEGSVHILFVDDSLTVRTRVRRLLEAEGYAVETVADAEEALALAKQRAVRQTDTDTGASGDESARGFDIAIIDYFMPGSTGDRLCRRLRADPRTSGIITAIFTSTYMDRVISDALAAGAVECMFKNESDALFLARVAAMSRSARITRRIERERSRLQGILSSVGDGVYGVDPQGRITFMNPAALRILDYEQEQAADCIGHLPSALFHLTCPQLEGGSCESCILEQALSAGQGSQAVESVFTRRDGTTVQVEMTVYPLAIEGRREGAVVAFRDISVRKLLEEELKWQASHDPLTRLYNRKYLEEALEQEIRRLRRGEGLSALLYLDLDRFKYINDTVGHAAGDRLLCEISRHLSGRLRESDLLARLGGDEFALILRGIGREDIFQVADEFRTMLGGYAFLHEGRNYTVYGSIGVTLLDRHVHSAAEALANADIACHIAKGQGRNQTHVFEPGCDERVTPDLELGWSSRLRSALDEDLFVLHYQPVVPLACIPREDMARPGQEARRWQHWAGAQPAQPPVYEVLLRLPDARGELVSPHAFIPTAERFNLMSAIDRWVLSRALSELAALHRQGRRIVFSINLSGQSLADAELAVALREALAQPGLDATSVVLEITETCAINCLDSARDFIEEFTALGCRFALDNFGSGYCSFAHLKQLAVDFIKIDSMFTQGIIHDAMDRAIIQSITDIAHSLGRLTVAEAVESPEVLRLLADSGVDFVQGWQICRPLAQVPDGSAPDGNAPGVVEAAARYGRLQ